MSERRKKHIKEYVRSKLERMIKFLQFYYSKEQRDKRLTKRAIDNFGLEFIGYDLYIKYKTASSKEEKEEAYQKYLENLLKSRK